MTAVENLLSHLNRVRRTGPDRWIASCPTRDDKHPSMAIRELSDGRVLLHDFGGDSVDEILAALGMGISELFPPRLEAPGPGKPHRERRPFDLMDVLTLLDFEVRLVLRYGQGMTRGETPSDGDLERLHAAVDRITRARRLYAL